MKYLVMYSGSLDSLLALASIMATKEDGEEVYMMVFDYGQKNMTKFEYAIRVAQFYKIMEQDKVLPDGTTDEHFFINNLIPNCIVPDNDALTITQIGTLALGYAVNKGINQIIFGTNEDEYLEKSLNEVEEYLDAVYDSFAVSSTKPGITLFDSGRNATWESIAFAAGNNYKVPYELAMTCELGEYPFCGKCEHCKARKEAFSDAGIEDTALYQ